MNTVTLTEDEQFFDVQSLTDCLQERQPQKVNIFRRWRQSQHPWSASPLPLECRDVPSILLHPAYKDDTQAALYLVKPLQVGPEQWSQVWEGSLRLDTKSKQDHQPARVVIKLFQESRFPRSWPASPLNPRTGPTHGAEHAKREAWAYNVLRSMQGTLHIDSQVMFTASNLVQENSFRGPMARSWYVPVNILVTCFLLKRIQYSVRTTQW